MTEHQLPPGPVLQDVFCSVTWRSSLMDTTIPPPPEAALLTALDLGSTAWEDSATLQWPVFLAHKQLVPGRVSVEVDARTLGPRPYAAQLLVVFPLKPFDPDQGADMAVARGVQWTPGTLPKIKLTNRTTTTKAVEAEVQVATAYATNCDDVERMLLLKEPAPPVVPSDPPPWRPPTAAPASGTQGDCIRVSEINTGPLSVGARATLLKIVSVQLDKGLFPANDKTLTTVHGREVEIPLIDENVTPVACKHQRHNPVHADIINTQVDKWKEMGIVEYSDSQWASRISLQAKKDGKSRLTLDYRPLNALTKKNSGGLGSLASMHDRIRKSNWFTLLDLPQAYHQIPIKPSDRHKTAFRDARGRLYQFTRCGFGLTTIPAVFSARLGDTLRPVESKGCVERWLDDILIHTETLEEHFQMLEEVLDLLQKDNYSVHFHKSQFCMAEVEFLGVMVGRSGVRPPLSKITPLTEMEKPTTVGALRSVIGMTNFMRDFVEGFSAKIAPLSDILRNKDFSTKQARNKPIPWGKAQDEAFDAIIRALVSPPVLLPPDWDQPFTLHTDASEIAAGAALTQEIENRDAVIGYGSKRWTPAEARHAPTIREVRGVLFGLDHFRTYLLHRPFTLVVDCSAITWLFTSQHLSSTMYRYALRMMEFSMTLRWRKGTEHALPDALSRLPKKGPAGPPVDTSFPDDNTSPGDRTSEPTGPVFDGVPLRDVPSKRTMVPTPESDLPLAVLWALQHTPAPLDPMDQHGARTHEEVRHALSPRHPRAVVLGCGAGGAMLALRDVLQMHTAIDPDWTALECARANPWSQDVTLVRAPLAQCGEAVAEAKPEILVGNACSGFDPQRIGSTATTQAEDIIRVFPACRATVLILECPVRFTGTPGWKTTLRPLLERNRCSVEEATLKATNVGVPTGKQRVFIVASKRPPGTTGEELITKLSRWRQRVQQPASVTPTVGSFSDRGGHYFLRRPLGEKVIFSVDAPSPTLTCSHIMGRRPPIAEYRAHLADDAPPDTAEDLQWDDFVKLTTAQDNFCVPPTVRRRDAALALVTFTLPPMLREAFSAFSLRESERWYQAEVGDRRGEGRRYRSAVHTLAAMSLNEHSNAAPTERRLEPARLSVAAFQNQPASDPAEGARPRRVMAALSEETYVALVDMGLAGEESKGTLEGEEWISPEGAPWVPFRRSVNPVTVLSALEEFTTLKRDAKLPRSAALSAQPVPSYHNIAWEDDSTLGGKLQLIHNEVNLVGSTSSAVEVAPVGPRPQDRQLVMITPTARRVKSALGHIEGVFSWLDDILIASDTWEEHLATLTLVMTRLLKAGLSGNFEKCIFGAASQEFLGMVIDSTGIRPAPSKLAATAELARPTTVEELRTFLGMTGYLRQFVPLYVQCDRRTVDNILRHQEFASKRARKSRVPWSEEEDAAFRKLRECLSSPLVLAFPDMNSTFELHTDASTVGAGATLMQTVGETQNTRGLDNFVEQRRQNMLEVRQAMERRNKLRMEARAKANATISRPSAGFVVWKRFSGGTRLKGQVYDFKAPYWRVRYSGGNWEELTRTELQKLVAH
eukprot:g6222.t1